MVGPGTKDPLNPEILQRRLVTLKLNQEPDGKILDPAKRKSIINSLAEAYIIAEKANNQAYIQDYKNKVTMQDYAALDKEIQARVSELKIEAKKNSAPAAFSPPYQPSKAAAPPKTHTSSTKITQSGQDLVAELAMSPEQANAEDKRLKDDAMPITQANINKASNMKELIAAVKNSPLDKYPSPVGGGATYPKKHVAEYLEKYSKDPKSAEFLKNHLPTMVLDKLILIEKQKKIKKLIDPISKSAPQVQAPHEAIVSMFSKVKKAAGRVSDAAKIVRGTAGIVRDTVDEHVIKKVSDAIKPKKP